MAKGNAQGDMLLEVADTWQKGEPWDIVLRLSFYSLDAEVGMIRFGSEADRAFA